MSVFTNPMVGVCDEGGVFYCPQCLCPDEGCGSVFALDLASGDDAVPLCAKCGVDVLERDDLREWLSRPIGWQSVAHPGEVFCPSCFGGACVEDAGDVVVTLGDALRWTESDRRCSMCRDLLFW